jgi:hypothetical protein
MMMMMMMMMMTVLTSTNLSSIIHHGNGTTDVESKTYAPSGARGTVHCPRLRMRSHGNIATARICRFSLDIAPL